MLMSDYQAWLNAMGEDIAEDGQGGPATREATKAAFVNTHAPAITGEEVAAIASDLGCSVAQVMAVCEVEASGSGYDKNGRPKILYERHKFDDFTNGEWSVTAYSNPKSGHDGDSWDLLTQALCKDVDAAYKSCSWGAFQVMGFHFAHLGFASPLEMAFSTTLSEANQYKLFTGYITMAGLEDELRRVSNDPDDCRPFAEGYNGPAYEQYNYHERIAEAHQRLTA